MSKLPPPRVFEDCLKKSGRDGVSNGGSCERLPLGVTVVFSNTIRMPLPPERIQSNMRHDQ